MARRNRSPSLRRRPPSRDPRPLILVVCEGKNTEPQYIEAFSEFFGNRLVRVKVIEGAGAPKTIVERAIEQRNAAREDARQHRDSYLEYDEVWCVFDVDEHPRLGDAKQQARDNEIAVAISNPCFELWLLLHFQDQSAFLDRKQARSGLKKHCKWYDKNMDFPRFVAGYDAAVKRAQALEKTREASGDAGANRSTRVYALTEQIRKFGLAK